MISNKWIWLIALIFFLKALLLALWVTPLWDVPDETGHFSYARDIFSGNGIPVLGKSVIETDVKSNLFGRKITKSHRSYIAQHPPVYYILAGSVWKLASVFTDEPDLLFRSPRIMSAASGALTLVVLYFLLVLVSGNRLASLGFAICVGFIPMFSHLSSGTNHDTTLTLFATLTTYYWAKFLIGGKSIKHAYYAAFWLSLACVTKLTALVMAAPMLIIMVFEIESPWKLRIRHASGVFMIWLILPGFWMIRSYYYHGRFLVTHSNVVGGFRLEDNPLTDSFYKYITTQNAAEQFFIQFFGMFGFVGTGNGTISLLNISSWPLVLYSIVVILLLLTVSFYITHSVILKKKPYSQKRDSVFEIILKYGSSFFEKSTVRYAIIGFALIVALFCWLIPVTLIYRKIIFFLLVFIWVASLFSIFLATDKKDRLIFYAWFVFAFFVSILLNQVYHFYLLDGRLRATQGRYLFPMIPLMMTGIFIPALQLLKKYASHLFLLLALAMAFIEMNVYLTQVLPFYMHGK